jgi:hypothetical protein
MNKYVEFPLQDGGSILIETSDEKRIGSGFVKPGEAAPEIADKARHSFDDSVENIRKSADLLVTRLRALSEPPDEMEVFFSLKVSGELGSLAIAKAGAEANYNVTLKWRREDKKDDKKDEDKKD